MNVSASGLVAGWLRLVRSFKWLFSFAKEPYQRDLYSEKKKSTKEDLQNEDEDLQNEDVRNDK